MADDNEILKMEICGEIRHYVEEISPRSAERVKAADDRSPSQRNRKYSLGTRNPITGFGIRCFVSRRSFVRGSRSRPQSNRELRIFASEAVGNVLGKQLSGNAIENCFENWVTDQFSMQPSFVVLLSLCTRLRVRVSTRERKEFHLSLNKLNYALIIFSLCQVWK